MILVQVVPHELQRYDTVGDWKFINDNLVVSVSDCGDELSNVLVAIHEIVEAFLCKKDGVKEEDVTRFDIEFESKRGPLDKTEPGCDPRSPYKAQHQAAESVERLAAIIVGVDWDVHESRIEGVDVGTDERSRHKQEAGEGPYKVLSG